MGKTPSNQFEVIEQMLIFFLPGHGAQSRTGTHRMPGTAVLSGMIPAST